MMFAEDDLDFIRRRLDNTVVSYKDEPVLVVSNNRVGAKIKTKVIRLVDEYEEVVPLRELDFRPVNLGYLNRRAGNATWLSRVPVRAWQQGLSQANVTSTDGGVDIWDSRKQIRDMVMGIYPTLDRAAKSGVKKAFAKDFAINTDQTIMYKDKYTIGNYEDGRVVLADRYIYLREYLGEVLG